MNIFYYSLQTLRERISTEVLYKVRKRAESNNNLDDNSTKDADLIINEYIQTIATDIFNNWLSPMGRTLADLDTPEEPFEYDVSFTPPEDGATELDNQIVYRVIFPDKFDSITVPAIDRAIADCIVSYSVWQWLMDSNVKEWQLYENKYETSKQKLVDLVSRRINPRRTYNLY